MNNNYVERYVYDVVRRIDDKQRDDVKKELTANIYDMLPDNPTNEDIEKVLKSLGKPSEIAAKYRNTSNDYLISPRYYTDYVRTLKIAMIVLSTLIVLGNVLQHLFAASSVDIAKVIEIFISETVEGVVEGIFMAFTLVTIVFIIIERNNKADSKVEKNWELKDLATIPSHKDLEINRFSVFFDLVFTLIFNIIFVYLFFNHNKFLGWFKYNANDELEMFVTIFNNGIRYFIIGFIILTIFDLIVSIYKITTGIKTYKLIIVNGIKNILTIITIALVFTTKVIVNSELFVKISEQTGLELQTILNGYNKGVNGMIIAFSVILVAYIGHLVWEFIELKKIQQTINN